MLKNLIPLAAVILALISFINFALPEGAYDVEFSSYLIILTIITLVSARYVLKKANNNITVGFIMIVMFYIYSLVGSINYYLVKFMFPGFLGGIENTYKYWLSYTAFFMIGYLVVFKKIQFIKAKRFAYYFSDKLLVAFVIIGIIGTVGASIEIGFIPILVKGAGAKRYFTEMGIFLDLWALNLPTSILIFYHYLKTKKKWLLIVFLVVLLQNSLFIARYNFMFAALACLLLYFAHTKLTRKLVLRSLVLLVLFFIVNSLYLSQREGTENPLEVQNSGELSTVQTKYIYVTFNEFRQLNILVNTYDNWLWGETFLSLPVSFLPYQFWEAVGVDKAGIKEKNSALIMKEETGSVGGVRTGLAGELFINFGFWGSILMVVFGAIIGSLDNFYRALPRYDVRKIIVVVFQVILIYGCLVGQIDTMSTALATNTQFFLVLFIFFTRKIPVQNPARPA